MRYSAWTDRLSAFVTTCRRIGAVEASHPTHPRCAVGAVASREAVAHMESQLGMSFPKSLRNVLLHYSASLDARWQFAHSIESPGPTWGQCYWRLADFPDLLATYRAICNDTFSNTHDSYDLVWHGRFPIMAVPNGDMLAIALNGPPEVVYLSHDDGEGHGYRLGADFEDFMDRWTAVGCAGPEDWEWLSFTSSPGSYLEPKAPAAVSWRRWAGVAA